MDGNIAGKHHVKDPERKCTKTEKRSQGNKNGRKYAVYSVIQWRSALDSLSNIDT